MFKQITTIPPHQIAAQLYNLCDNTVQNILINNVSEIFQLFETDLLKSIESVVTKRSNPTVHRMHFGNITQSPSESIQDYIVWLKSTAIDCGFSCPRCQCDLVPPHVKDQFISGLFNNTLQTDILANASHLQTFEQLIVHAEAFETALRDQLTLNDTTTLSSISCISDYRKRHQNKPTWSSSPCPGCGSHSHGTPGTNDWSTKCPAWGKNCLNCSIPNHFAKVCRKDKCNPDSANALIAHVFYDQQKDTYTSCQNNNAEEILVQLKPAQSSQRKFTTLSIFPDSGASICLAGPKHINQLGIHNN